MTENVTKDFNELAKKNLSHSKMQKAWRPMIAYVFGSIALIDFVVFPVCWSLLQFYNGDPITQWQPLTLSEGGLFYLALGSILGISSWTRGQEKVEMVKKTNFGMGSSAVYSQVPVYLQETEPQYQYSAQPFTTRAATAPMYHPTMQQSYYPQREPSRPRPEDLEE